MSRWVRDTWPMFVIGVTLTSVCHVTEAAGPLINNNNNITMIPWPAPVTRGHWCWMMWHWLCLIVRVLICPTFRWRFPKREGFMDNCNLNCVEGISSLGVIIIMWWETHRPGAQGGVRGVTQGHKSDISHIISPITSSGDLFTAY